MITGKDVLDMLDGIDELAAERIARTLQTALEVEAAPELALLLSRLETARALLDMSVGAFEYLRSKTVENDTTAALRIVQVAEIIKRLGGDKGAVGALVDAAEGIVLRAVERPNEEAAVEQQEGVEQQKGEGRC